MLQFFFVNNILLEDFSQIPDHGKFLKLAKFFSEILLELTLFPDNVLIKPRELLMYLILWLLVSVN